MYVCIVAITIIMTVDVIVRHMKAGDEATVADIWHQGLRQTADANWIVIWPIMQYKMKEYGNEALSEKGDMGPKGNKLLEVWSRKDRAMLVASLADNPNHIVGVVGVKKGASQDQDEPDSTVASIWKMSVDPSVRRCGLGHALMRAAEEHARDTLNCTTLVLITANPIAGNFYSKVGFSVVHPEKRWYDSFNPEFYLVKRYSKAL
jgi:ribosomal protein S18 acetylase RimI-like enzyme